MANKKILMIFPGRRGFYKGALKNTKFVRCSHRSVGQDQTLHPRLPVGHEKDEYAKWSKKVEVIVQGIKRQAAMDKRPFLNVKVCHSLPSKQSKFEIPPHGFMLVMVFNKAGATRIHPRGRPDQCHCPPRQQLQYRHNISVKTGNGSVTPVK